MNRRKFFKRLAVGSTALVFAPTVLAEITPQDELINFTKQTFPKKQRLVNQELFDALNEFKKQKENAMLFGRSPLFDLVTTGAIVTKVERETGLSAYISGNNIIFNT